MKFWRFLLIITIMFAAFPIGHSQSSVAILTSDNKADESVATVWAQKIGATLVVTPWGSLTDKAKADVVATGANVVYVVGGDVAVPGAENGLKGYGLTVIRVGGETREETSLKVAERFSNSRAVILEGYDYGSMGNAIIVGATEGIPLIFIKGTDLGAGEKLKENGVSDVTLFSNPAFQADVKDSVKNSGIKITDSTIERRNLVITMIDMASERIKGAEVLVRTIKYGYSLAGARLIVDSNIQLTQARDSLDAMRYGDAFKQTVAAHESALHANYVYNGKVVGSLSDALSTADSDISSRGITIVKDELKQHGSPYGIGLPVPPVIDLSDYMVDIEGYTKRILGEGAFYDMAAKYTKGKDRSVSVEIFKRESSTDAVDWMKETQFSTKESRDWESITFLGEYPASTKRITVSVTDRITQEVFMRVAVGNLGVFTKYTQGVSSREPQLLIPQEEAVSMVEEVTAEVIRAIEESQ